MFRRTALVVVALALATFTVHAQDPATYEGLKNLMDEETDYLLVDVRTPAEYGRGHIPTATNTPHTRIGRTPPTEDKDALIVLYCATGIRSGQAARVLRKAGYTNVIDFGSLPKWKGEISLP